MIEAFTPDDLTPEQLEIRNFKKSPLAKRISDDILNPRVTRDLLTQKKSQFKQLIRDKDNLKLRVTQTYFLDTSLDPFHHNKMPSIRIFPSKGKHEKEKPQQDYNLPELQSISFPDVSEVFWNKIDLYGWKPETRQQATLTVVQNKLYLVGGVSRSINSDVNFFFPSYKKWEKVSTTGVEAEPRFGHSTVEYKKKLYVFGGGTDFNSIHKVRECLNGVKSMNIETNEWFNARCEGSYIGTRKNHCAGIIGKHMFIHGGVNQKNNLLEDAAVLNLDKLRWKCLSVKGLGPGAIGFHTAAAVLISEQKNCTSIYKIPPTKGKNPRLPGIYVFGGIGENRKAHNELYILQVGSRPLYWTKPVTQGRPPSPRFHHSMCYNDKLDILIIFGGRIDDANASQYTCFNDVFVLKVDSLLWTTIKVCGNIPAARSGHCAASIGSKVYIFAGVSTSTYCNSDLFMLELSPKVARNMIEEDEKRKARDIEIEIFRARRAGASQEDRVKDYRIDLEFE
jgi:N-acetylneuraminic acid mutarotase